MSDLQYNNDVNECNNNSEEEEKVAVLPSETPLKQMNLRKRKFCTEKIIFKNKIKKEKNDLVDTNIEERKHIKNAINNVEGEESIDAFFKYMALTVKKFSPQLKIKAKQEIFNIITILEVENNSDLSIKT